MGGKISFDSIFEEFHPKILRYLTRLAGPQEAEDLVQEVFEKVNRALKDFRGESKPSTWLYRIATNTAIDKLKTRSFKLLSGRSTLGEESGAEDRDVWTGERKPLPDQGLIREEMNECIRGFIEGLPSDYRTVLVLSDLEGFKNREIADILQISLDTVKIRLHRARAGLRKELEANCSFYHDERNELACDRAPTFKDNKA